MQLDGWISFLLILKMWMYRQIFLPQSLPGAIVPGTIIFLTADTVVAEVRENLTGARQALWIYEFFRIP